MFTYEIVTTHIKLVKVILKGDMKDNHYFLILPHQWFQIVILSIVQKLEKICLICHLLKS